MKIIRVFPRKTNASPDDDLVRFREPDLFDEADEVHISVAFTYDIPRAEKLAIAWKYVAPVKIGGPAFNEPGGNFVPGMYLKKGLVITSRGCPNRCWFCSVPIREGGVVRELPITEGNNLLDDNILACSEKHIHAVFEMLSKQKQVVFTGGLEAKRLKEWHVHKLAKLKLARVYFAYDTPDDLEPLIYAGKLMNAAGINAKKRQLCAYVLIGYPKDSIELAEKRLMKTLQAGFIPMAMLWRDKDGNRNSDWMKFTREWARPAIIGAKFKI